MSNPKSVMDTNGIRYELTELLGRGGQGAVYAVRDAPLAVKLVAGRGLKHRERMRNQLTHVRRLPIYDLPIANPLEMLRPPHTGYVMELLTGMAPIKNLFVPAKGETIGVEWYLQTGGLRRRLLVLARAAHTLAQLHGKGLAYSDPSPANIFVSEDPSFTEVRFIDTDNLRYESAPGTMAGVYTPGYGAPELVQGHSGVNTLTDAYAFAVIAFQVLALTHPFVGDYVNDGEPELEEQAFSGQLPWVDDTEDDLNRASFGVPREWVLSRRLAETFQGTFGAGRRSPAHRPGAIEWAERLFSAADATIFCSGCGGSFYFNQPSCPWCGDARPTFATSVVHLWDPQYGDHGGILAKPHKGTSRPVLAGHGAVTEGIPFTITRRLAFGTHTSGADEPVVDIGLAGNCVTIRSRDGHKYRLSSASGGRFSTVSDQAQTLRLTPGQASWRLHFGDKDRLHRVVSFELRPGKTA